MRPHWFYFFARFSLMLLSVLLIPTCWLYSIGKRKKCPTIDNPLLLKSAKTLAHLIRTRQVTSEEVIRAYITRIEAVNKITNAIVEDRFKKALEEAAAVDKALAENFKSALDIEKDTPLLGVPVTIKESIMVEGMSCNVACGDSDVYKRADRDAFVVQQIKNAGGIIMCVTNTPELCMFWETYNNFTGITRNPYDTRRSVGGSSGGEAALISSASSVVGLGSDLAGSLRLPASFTGIFAHKPSPHLISIDGYQPKCHDERYSNFIVTGPLTRYAEDMPLMLSVLATPGIQNTFSEFDKVSISNLKIYYMEQEYNSFLARKVDRNIINAMHSFMNYLKNDYKIECEKIEIEEMCHSFTRSFEVLINLDKIESQYLDENLNFTKFWRVLFRFLTFQSKTSCPIIAYGIVKKIYFLLINKFNKHNVFQRNEQLKNKFQTILGENGVFLYPTWPGLANYHFETFYKIINFGYCAIFNMLGFPVTSVPAGFSSNGLPIGFQVISFTNNDHLTLAVALEAEKYFGGWKAPIN